MAPLLGRLPMNVWAGAIASGLILSFIAIGIYVSFRVLNFPDLTVDGTFPLGAALAATMITAGVNPFLTLPAAMIAGAIAGAVTALIATRLHIHSLLASILTVTALISINLRIMGRSNIPLMNSPTIFTPLASSFRKVIEETGSLTLSRAANNLFTILYIGMLVILVKLAFDWFMKTEHGLKLRASGDNPGMMRALGTDTNRMMVFGLAISNALVGLSGAIFAQYQGFADVNMGTGMIIAGLAAVILGETLFRPQGSISRATTAVILGMVVYRLVIAAALSIAIPLPGGNTLRVDAQDVKLATAVLVLAALGITHMRKKREVKP
jgi:putative ABC transport system permease protein